MKKNAFVRFYHRDAHYYVIISHNSSVPVIGIWNWLLEHLRHMYHGRGLQRSRGFSPWSQIFLRCIRADLDLIVNEFKQIRLIGYLIMNAIINCHPNGFQTDVSMGQMPLLSMKRSCYTAISINRSITLLMNYFNNTLIDYNQLIVAALWSTKWTGD